jgi:hypothetical protein
LIYIGFSKKINDLNDNINIQRNLFIKALKEQGIDKTG